jgi:hypothetical protein
MRVGTRRQNIIILFWIEQFHFWEYINGNQTFIKDFHWPFICSVEAKAVFAVVLIGSAVFPHQDVHLFFFSFSLLLSV